MALTDKQEQFCLEYLKDLNATQASIRAGYSESTAFSIGSENLRKPEVYARIRELMEERKGRTLVDADFVISGLIDVANRCRQAEPVMIFDPVEKAMVQKRDDEGNALYEFDSMGAVKALDLLGKHLGVFEKDNQQKKPESVELIIKGKKFADKD